MQCILREKLLMQALKLADVSKIYCIESHRFVAAYFDWLAEAEKDLSGLRSPISVLLQAAEVAATEGMSLEVIDVRSLSPIDYAPILESVRKTGRCVIAQEAPGNVSLASELAATITEKAFYSLEAPVLRVTGFDTPFPPAQLEAIYLPDSDRVLDAVDRVLSY